MAARKQQNHVGSHSKPPRKRTKTFDVTEDVVETIVSHLPVKEACRLSILSKRFRHSWKFCRDLSFDRNFARNLSKAEFKKVVNKFFHDHLNSNADRFQLFFDPTGEAMLISYWIQKAVRLGIKEFELDFTPSPKSFMLSHDLVDVESIKIVKLIKCELHLPLNSNGLRHLRELTFQNVRARPVAVKAVFLNCLSLRTFQLIQCNCIYNLIIAAQDLKGFKTLVVKNCSDYDSIAINAPTLCSLHYHGKICEFKFQSDLPQLNDAIFEIEYSRDFQLLSLRNDMVTTLGFVKILTVSSTFLEGLSTRFVESANREIEFYFWKLREFHLVVTTESYLNPTDVVIFLKKCPSVERVFIDLGKNAFGNSVCWNINGRKYLSECETVFPVLKYVKMKGFTMGELPVIMARFFLKNAIFLHSLVLVKARNYNFSEFFTPDCLRSGIASNANVEMYDYNQDTSIVIPEQLKGF